MENEIVNHKEGLLAGQQPEAQIVQNPDVNHNEHDEIDSKINKPGCEQDVVTDKEDEIVEDEKTLDSSNQQLNDVSSEMVNEVGESIDVIVDEIAKDTNKEHSIEQSVNYEGHDVELTDESHHQVVRDNATDSVELIMNGAVPEVESCESIEAVDKQIADRLYPNVKPINEDSVEVKNQSNEYVNEVVGDITTDSNQNESNEQNLNGMLSEIKTAKSTREVIEDLPADGNQNTSNDEESNNIGAQVEIETEEMIDIVVTETVEDVLNDVVDVIEMADRVSELLAALTEDQKALLENIFQDQANPDLDVLEALAISMELTLEQATAWFEWRNAEEREPTQNVAPAQVVDRGPAPNEYWQPHQQIGNEDDEAELTWYQVMMMENLFESGPFPDAGLRAAVAASIGLSDTKVQAWFAQRRAISGIREPVENNPTQRVAIDRQYPQGVLEAFMELPEPDENYQIGQMADENQDKEFSEELKRRMSCEVCNTENQKAYRCSQCMTGFCKKCHKCYMKYPTYVSPTDNRVICEFCHHPQREFQKLVIPRM